MSPSEPTHSAVVEWVLAGGVSAAISHTFGVDPIVILWAMLGSMLGPLLKERAGWWSALGTFIAASIFSAGLAQALAEWRDMKPGIMINALAGLVGLGFPLIRDWFLHELPAWLKKLATKVGIGSAE